ncbi:hypothetical protein BHM03_00017604 [Ensete ventricosum]|nr:hypothetical protein BHM03_00017604 [Ensete ventricosum]
MKKLRLPKVQRLNKLHLLAFELHHVPSLCLLYQRPSPVHGSHCPQYLLFVHGGREPEEPAVPQEQQWRRPAAFPSREHLRWKESEQRRDGGFFAAEGVASRREKGGHWLSASPLAMRASSTQYLFFRMSIRFLNRTSVTWSRDRRRLKGRWASEEHVRWRRVREFAGGGEESIETEDHRRWFRGLAEK